MEQQANTLSSDVQTRRERWSSSKQDSTVSATTKKIKRKPLHAWDEDEIVTWMKKHIGEGYYKAYGLLFKEHAITGRTLLRMNDEILQRMGITDSVHRQELLTKIQLLILKNDLIDLKKMS